MDHGGRNGTVVDPVVVVGGGAAGVIIARCLIEVAGTTRPVLVIDPQERPGPGVAYSTKDHRHLLNVAAGKMSASLTDPDEFTDWSARRGQPSAGSGAALRLEYGQYLHEVFCSLRWESGGVVSHLRDQVVDVVLRDGGALVELKSGRQVAAAAMVLATGSLPPSSGWAPAELSGSERFIADPWAPHALSAVTGDDVVLVGAGLTAHDVAVALERPGRTLTTLSRSGLRPAQHRASPTASMSPPDFSSCDKLEKVENRLKVHLRRAVQLHGDWRPAIDSIRPVADAVWAGLSSEDKDRFLRTRRRQWEVLRHRLPRETSRRVTAMRRRGAFAAVTGGIVDVREGSDGVRLSLADGRCLTAQTVVNCTGATLQVDCGRKSSLVARLMSRGVLTAGPAGLGVATCSRGRVSSPVRGALQPVMWVVGALRRGCLWETTAIPEIRQQCANVAQAVVSTVG